MRFLSILAALLFTLPTALLSQNKNVIVEGRVVDSTNAALPAVTLVLMQKQDSVMAGFGTANPEGRFALRRVSPGEYILQLNYVGYETQYVPISVKPDNPKTDLGNIVLKPSSLLLGGVEVKAYRAPIVFKKDTIEYNAEAFKTQPGAVVEDLLKRLPGVEVQGDGSIRAQGETVRNVLVDGKEFFGQDPKIATKNLPAEAVDKVQVYDQKSEKAQFTGIEDGQEQKTINLKLKEDHKKGYFGNILAGFGTKDRYEGRFNVNRFSKKTQLSAIGMGNNNNKQGFSFDDYLSFMGGLSGLMSGGGGSSSSPGSGRMRIAFDPSEMGVPIGQGMNNGFTTTWAGGLNFNSDLSSKTRLNGNYFYNRLRQDIDRTVTRENILNDQNFASRNIEDRFSRNANHRLDLRLRHTIDSFQDFTLRTRLNMNDALFTSLSNSETFDPLGAVQNKGLRDYEADGDNFFGNASFIYRRRFGKKGRAFVADLFARKDDDTRDGDLLATNEFQTSNPLETRQSISQRQAYTNDASSYGATLSYTEPLGKRQYLEGALTRQEYKNNTVKDFYDRVSTPTPGEVFNPLLSNNFRRGYLYDRGGLNYMLNRNKYNLTAGAALQHAQLDGELVDENIPVRYAFTRVLPNLFFNYELATSKNMSFSYTTGVREPSLEQLQPAVDNSDPLNVYAGNPNLRPEYEHNFDLDFMVYDQFTMRSFFASLNTNYTRDRITNASSVDSLFRRFMQPVNVEYDLLTTGSLHFSTPVKFMKSRFSLALNATYNRGILFVNDVRNNTDRWINSIDLSFDNIKKEKLDLNFGVRFTQNSTQYSVSDALNQSFVNQRYFVDGTFFPNKKWAIGTGFNYVVYSKESFGEQRAVPLLRADITRYILKNKRGQLKFSAFDIFDQNIGINRRSQFNYIEEERIRNLSRYFMLTFGYSLAGFGQRQPGGIHIQMRDRD